MILRDVNLLVYAYNADAPRHAAASARWEGLMNGGEPVGLPWPVICGFVPLMTHPSVLVTPLEPDPALGHVRTCSIGQSSRCSSRVPPTSRFSPGC